MSKEPLAHLWFFFLAILLTLCSFVLLRHGAILYHVVIGEDRIQFVQSFSLDEELSLKCLQRDTKYVLLCFALLNIEKHTFNFVTTETVFLIVTLQTANRLKHNLNLC